LISDQVLIALPLDPHDSTLAPIIDTPFDADLVAFLEANLLRTEVSDMFLVVFCDGDEVLHSLGGDGEVILLVGEGRLSDKDDVVSMLDIVIDLIQSAFDKEQFTDGRNKGPVFLPPMGFDHIGKRYERLQPISPGIIPDLEFFL
jgi:hypothetical protein